MNKNKQLTSRIVAILIIAFGILFGGTWNSTKFCLGDAIFYALGIPAWSNGANGTHYPAIVGTVVILIGICVLNSTLQKKTRLLTWAVAIVIIIIINLLFICI